MTPSQPFPDAAVAARRPGRPCIAVFGTETALSERIKAFEACDLRVARCTLPEPDRASGRRRLRRVVSLALAVPALLRARRHLAQVDAFWVRDLDIAVVALLARLIARTRAPLAYEVLEVPPVFVGRGLGPFLLRLVERIVLARSDLLVVGSRDLMGHYFAPVQGYAAPWSLLGDRIHGDGGMAELCRRLLSRAAPSTAATRQKMLARG